MTEKHLSSDELVDLALGTLLDPRQDSAVDHLVTCPGCQAFYDELAGGIDLMLPSAPRVSPQPGFENKMLDAMHPARTHPQPGRRAIWPLLVTALVCLLVGIVGTVAISGEAPGGDKPVVPTATVAAPMTTSGGDEVGTVTAGWYEGRHVLVVAVTGAKPGARYECRLLMADGSTREVGNWQIRRSQSPVWVLPAPANRVVEVQLMTETGRMWSSAHL